MASVLGNVRWVPVSGWVLLLPVLLLPAQAFAQDTPEGPAFALPLDFAPPGARSASLGRAFIGLADDATAASANPAGLVKLPRPEISYHFRVTSSETFSREFFGGNGLQRSTGTSTVPAFFSVVIPMVTNTLAVSAFYSEEVNARNTFEQAVTFSVAPGQIGQRRVLQSNALVVSQTGVALGYALGSRFAIGAAFRSSKAALDFAEDLSFYDEGLGRGQLFTRQRVDSASRKPTWTVGTTVQAAPALSIGGVYRRGTVFSLPGTETRLIRASAARPTQSEVVAPYVQTISIPDSYGAGLALRPPEGRFTITFDAVRVEYSDLVTVFASRRLTDATELHGGFEYRWPLTTTRLLALRFGAYSDPGHHPFEGQEVSINIGQRDEELHTSQVFATAGAGVVLSNIIQLDVAVRRAKYVTDIAVSTVVRF